MIRADVCAQQGHGATAGAQGVDGNIAGSDAKMCTNGRGGGGTIELLCCVQGTPEAHVLAREQQDGCSTVPSLQPWWPKIRILRMGCFHLKCWVAS